MASGPLAALLAVLASSPLWILLTHAVVSPPIEDILASDCRGGRFLVGTCPHGPPCGGAGRPRISSLGSKPIEVVYFLIVYPCTAYSYFHPFNLSETGRRVRILREFRTAGSLTAQEISSRYSPALVIELRLALSPPGSSSCGEGDT